STRCPTRSSARAIAFRRISTSSTTRTFAMAETSASLVPATNACAGALSVESDEKPRVRACYLPAVKRSLALLIPAGALGTPPGSGTYVANICITRVPDADPPLRVKPGDPTESYLVWKITGVDDKGAPIEKSGTDQGCAEMPRVAGGALPADTVKAIKTWIAN